MTGDEPGAHPSGAGGGGNAGMHPFANMGRGGFTTVFDDEIDPEEIFRMFFGGNPFMSTAQGNAFANAAARRNQHARQRQAQQQQQQTHSSPETTILKLLTSLYYSSLQVLLALPTHYNKLAITRLQSQQPPTRFRFSRKALLNLHPSTH